MKEASPVCLRLMGSVLPTYTRRIALQAPMNEYTGVYCHLVTLQPPKGKPVTMLYTGGAQQGLLDSSKSELGIGMRLSGYSNTEGEHQFIGGGLSILEGLIDSPRAL